MIIIVFKTEEGSKISHKTQKHTLTQKPIHKTTHNKAIKTIQEHLA